MACGTAAAGVSSPVVAHAAGAVVPCPQFVVAAPTIGCTTTDGTPGDGALTDGASATPPAEVGPAGSTADEGCADADLKPRSARLGRIEDATLCLINEARAKRGLRALMRNRALDRVAGSYARFMVDAGFFGHVTPRGSTLSQRVRGTNYLHGLRHWDLGENLHWGTGTLGSPERTVRSWMRSPGHRHNILDRRYREIGIGVAIGIPVRLRNAPTGATYAHVFGRRVPRVGAGRARRGR